MSRKNFSTMYFLTALCLLKHFALTAHFNEIVKKLMGKGNCFPTIWHDLKNKVNKCHKTRKPQLSFKNKVM